MCTRMSAGGEAELIRWFHRAASAFRAKPAPDKRVSSPDRYAEIVASLKGEPTAAQLRELMSAAYQAKLYAECGLLVSTYKVKGFPPHDFVDRTDALLARRQYVDLSQVVLGVAPHSLVNASAPASTSAGPPEIASDTRKTPENALRSATPREVWGVTAFDEAKRTNEGLTSVSEGGDAIVKLLAIDPCALSIWLGFECFDEVPARKAATLSVFFYDNTGKYISGPSTFRVSPRIGPYLYIPATRGLNNFDSLVEAPSDAAFVFVRLMSWDCAIGVKGPSSLRVQDWNTFANNQWALLLNRYRESPESGAWLRLEDDRWVEIQRPEQILHFAELSTRNMRLEIDLASSAINPFRGATTFFSKPFSAALDCIDFCLERGIPVSLRADARFLDSVPENLLIERRSI